MKVKKILAALSSAAIIIGSIGSTCVYAFENSVREGVVPIVMYMKDVTVYSESLLGKIELEKYDELARSSGSGFFVGDGKSDPQYIVTNHHVVADYLDNNEGGGVKITISQNEFETIYCVVKSCELRVYYSENDYDIAYVDCYGDMEKVDLAVLRLKDSTEKRHALPIKPTSNDMVADTVYTVGFPGNADNELTGASKYGVDDVTVHSGVINKFVVNEGKGVERIAIDATIQHGNSGGPLVDEAGNVLGVNTNVMSTSPYTNQIEADYYAISSNELIRFLDKNNITYTKASGSSNFPAAGIAIGAVVVLAGAAGAAVFLKKKKTGAPSGGRKKGKAYVVGMSSQHNGKKFAVEKSVTIGRDTSGCDIIFKEGTPGISGKHCTVSYDPASGEFTLTDLNSSYGTFLANGTKVTAPVKLKSGDMFYAGEKGNVCKVEVEQ